MVVVTRLTHPPVVSTPPQAFGSSACYLLSGALARPVVGRLFPAKLEALRNSAMLARRAQMRTLLHRRMPGSDERVIEILAAAIIAATNAATKDWATGRQMDFVAAAHENLRLILVAAEMLDKPTGG